MAESVSSQSPPSSMSQNGTNNKLAVIGLIHFVDNAGNVMKLILG
jgi:hypothetical protein